MYLKSHRKCSISSRFGSTWLIADDLAMPEDITGVKCFLSGYILAKTLDSTFLDMIPKFSDQSNDMYTRVVISDHLRP